MDLDFKKMDRVMVAEVLDELATQLKIVNPLKFHNCVSYAAWYLKKDEGGDKDLKISKLESELKHYTRLCSALDAKLTQRDADDFADPDDEFEDVGNSFVGIDDEIKEVQGYKLK